MRFKSGSEGKVKLLFLTILIQGFSGLARFGKSKSSFWKNLSDIVSYRCYIESLFPSEKLKWRRESLFNFIFKSITSKEVCVYEYGVAHGFLAAYSLPKFDKQIHCWNGFDTFTCLPEPWRELPENYFDNGGIPPYIPDSRVIWHKGLVQETLNDRFFLNSTRTSFHIFDLDLFEPSLFVWQTIRDFLRAGDILYFDEAFDDAERSLIHKYVLPFGKFRYLGSTITSLAIEYLGKYDNR